VPTVTSQRTTAREQLNGNALAALNASKDYARSAQPTKITAARPVKQVPILTIIDVCVSLSLILATANILVVYVLIHVLIASANTDTSAQSVTPTDTNNQMVITFASTSVLMDMQITAQVSVLELLVL